MFWAQQAYVCSNPSGFLVAEIFVGGAAVMLPCLFIFLVYFFHKAVIIIGVTLSLAGWWFMMGKKCILMILGYGHVNYHGGVD